LRKVVERREEIERYACGEMRPEQLMPWERNVTDEILKEIPMDTRMR